MTKFKLLFLAFLSLMANLAFSQDSIQQKIDHYISKAQLDSAKTYIENQLDRPSQKENINTLNYQLVKVLFIKSSYNEALEKAFNSLDSIDDEQQKVNFNFMIGCVYSAIADYRKSVEYFDLVVQHNRDSSLTVQTQLLLSELHLNLGDSINAKKSITEAHKITRLSNLDSKIKNHVAMQYNFFIENYELCKQLNLEIIRDSTSFLNAKSYAYSMIGDCLIKQDSLQEATTYFDSFLKLTFETKDPEQIKVAANKLITVYEKLGDQEKANAYHKIYNEAIADSLSFSVEKYRDLYDIEKKRELASLASINSKKYLIYSTLLLLLISGGIYYYFKSKHTTSADGKKIVISSSEIEKIVAAIDEFEAQQLFLKPNITRKSFCADNGIKSERYLSQYINEKYNKSFSVFINDLRVNYAYHRLENDSQFRKYKIDAIAKECGFGSKKSFERAFITKYQETPFKLISNLMS